jgi:two-component system CheB/CheR fusion protein
VANESETNAHCRALIVDDNVDGAETLAMLLRMDGHQVTTAYDGPAALEAADSQVPEVVLLDIGLPGMDGFEVARQLRNRPELATAYLVAMTGFNEETTREAQAGFDAHMVKPIDFGQLREVLAKRRSTP